MTGKKKLNKKDLLQAMQNAGLATKEAALGLEILLTVLVEGFKSDKPVTIKGFGTFTPKVRRGGKRRNPRTGEEVYVTDSLAVRFKLAKELTKLTKQGDL